MYMIPRFSPTPPPQPKSAKRKNEIVNSKHNSPLPPTPQFPLPTPSPPLSLSLSLSHSINQSIRTILHTHTPHTHPLHFTHYTLQRSVRFFPLSFAPSLFFTSVVDKQGVKTRKGAKESERKVNGCDWRVGKEKKKKKGGRRARGRGRGRGSCFWCCVGVGFGVGVGGWWGWHRAVGGWVCGCVCGWGGCMGFPLVYIGDLCFFFFLEVWFGLVWFGVCFSLCSVWRV